MNTKLLASITILVLLFGVAGFGLTHQAHAQYSSSYTTRKPSASTENYQQVLSTDKGKLKVGILTTPEKPAAGDMIKIKIDFLNPQTSAIQQHIDYKATVTKDGKPVFGPTPLTHVNSGTFTIPIEIKENGEYKVTVSVEGILFQVIPPETATFTIKIGEKQESSTDAKSSKTIESEKTKTAMQEKINGKVQPDSPRVQMTSGVSAQDIQCKEGFKLVFKVTNNMPACLKSSSVQRLIDRGWAKLGDTMMNANTDKVEEKTNKLELTAAEVDETYRWSDSNGINPTLTILDNANNVIQIQNPTDAKHEFVIESEGKEIAASGDISPDGSGTISINPTTTGVWEYHCEYHPATMKGTIKIVDQ